jgi:hypothetical protein
MKWQHEMRARLFRERNPEAFQRLRKEYPATWIDRVSRGRLAKLQPIVYIR